MTTLSSTPLPLLPNVSLSRRRPAIFTLTCAQQRHCRFQAQTCIDARQYTRSHARRKHLEAQRIISPSLRFERGFSPTYAPPLHSSYCTHCFAAFPAQAFSSCNLCHTPVLCHRLGFCALLFPLSLEIAIKHYVKKKHTNEDLTTCTVHFGTCGACGIVESEWVQSRRLKPDRF